MWSCSRDLMGLWIVPGGCRGAEVPGSGVFDGVVVSEGWQLVVEVLEQIGLGSITFLVVTS